MISHLKQLAKKEFGSMDGFKSVGANAGKVVVYVTSLESMCAKSKPSRELERHVEFKLDKDHQVQPVQMHNYAVA